MLVDTHFLPPGQPSIPLASAHRQGEQEVRALRRRSEVRTALDIGSEQSWLELVRDVVAVGNSGGGVLLVTLRAGDAAAGAKSATIAEVTAKSLRQRLRHFTGESFERLQANTLDPSNTGVSITVPAASAPVGFINAGLWGEPNDSTKQHAVFEIGTFHFFHGERSKPGTTDDMRAFLQARLQRLSDKLLGSIRRILVAPDEPDAASNAWPAMPKGQAEWSGQSPLQPVRIVTDPAAPALQPQDVERLYPLRQKELVQELNRRLGQRRRLNSYDIQAVRRHHRLDGRHDFVFNLPGAGRRYSHAAVDWLEQQAYDPAFFQEARAADQAMLKRRRRKPR